MVFSDKLNQIMRVLSVTNATLSNISEVHPSLISRFRSGERNPSENSTQFVKLCKGISLLIEEKSLQNQVNTIINIEEGISLTDSIRRYFYDTDPSYDDLYGNNPYKKNKSFNEKFNSVMSMLDLSNAKLAKQLDVDGSLISRYRSGQRTPQKGSELLNNLCTVIANMVVLGGHEKQMSVLTGIPEDLITSSYSDFADLLSKWFLNNTERQSSIAMDRFLKTIGAITFNKNSKNQSTSMHELMNVLQDTQTVYTGIEGFQRAILRFLVSVSLSKQPRTLKLYSDQKLDWLTQDPNFSQEWMTMMATVLISMNNIQIIHTVDREVSEMLFGIEKWMPLYMTGAVEAFYCKKHEDSNFAHTMFIAPGLSSVYAHIVSGSEDQGRYYYTEQKEDLEYIEDQYDALFQMTKPLVRVYNEKNISTYRYHMEEMTYKFGRTERILTSLNIATLSDSLLEKILIRNDFESGKIHDLLAAHKQYRSWFMQYINNGGVTDYVPLTVFESATDGSIPLVLPYLITDRPVFYTKHEQAEHLEDLCIFLKKCPDYQMNLLRDLPNNNIQISKKGDDSVTVFKATKPALAFWFGHQSMYHAFTEYFKMLERKVGIPTADKAELISVLEKYI